MYFFFNCYGDHRDLPSFPTRRSSDLSARPPAGPRRRRRALPPAGDRRRDPDAVGRSEEHTSELQSHSDLVCRLLLEKKKHTKDKTVKTEQTIVTLSAVVTA